MSVTIPPFLWDSRSPKTYPSNECSAWKWCRSTSEAALLAREHRGWKLPVHLWWVPGGFSASSTVPIGRTRWPEIWFETILMMTMMMMMMMWWWWWWGWWWCWCWCWWWWWWGWGWGWWRWRRGWRWRRRRGWWWWWRWWRRRRRWESIFAMRYGSLWGMETLNLGRHLQTITFSRFPFWTHNIPRPYRPNLTIISAPCFLPMGGPGTMAAAAWTTSTSLALRQFLVVSWQFSSGWDQETSEYGWGTSKWQFLMGKMLINHQT